MKKNINKNRFEEFEGDDEFSEFEDFSFDQSLSGFSKPVKIKNKIKKDGLEGKFRSEFSGKKKNKRFDRNNNFME